ncbi:hypothetical protein OIU84_022747 [Salix udensis]|uniref:Fungal lipase-type domain-containing protein n=1 Tax=Salix udensis TaxID=889485 RepID=A0AAD6PFK8_9ROSI|nr:hypothetical protein OIU84_022747 [Salix udensis]
MAAATSTATEFEYNTNDQEKSEGSIANYLIVRPEKGGMLDLLRYLAWADKGSGERFLESSEEGNMGEEAADHRWIILVSVIVRKIVSLFGKPMEYTGFVVDFFLNLLFQNGGIMGLFLNFLQGKVVIPQRDTDTFISNIGHLDGRIDLYRAGNLLEQIYHSGSAEETITEEKWNRAHMDLCIMASKLAYENAEVVQSIVVHHWKMHFVDFYNCWNDFQKEMSTQVFILCDKPKDANLILISFRGTEPFDADDWETDFDYSWYEIPKMGKVHMGFLEALGLGSRDDTTTFQYHLQMNNSNLNHDYEGSGSLSSNIDSETEQNKQDLSSDSDRATAVGNKKFLPDIMKTAYYAVRKKLKSLLLEHKNAKFIVTGHSLGGALAILFPSVLVQHQQMGVMKRLLGVYTFGQPRIGNLQLAKFMEAHLEYPIPKYFRVVYSDDLVPRLPYDDKTFLYKHFGVCLYYNSLYIERKVDEEPDPNFFGLRNITSAYLNAIWELIRSSIIGYTDGPEYKESWFMMLARITGLALPGIAAHCPTNYVNSVRLGKERAVQMSSF